MKAEKHDSDILKKVLSNIEPHRREQNKTRLLIAARIDDFMKEHKVGKSELASRMGKKPSEVTKWLSGTHNFTMDTLVHISHVLGVKLSTLIDEPVIQKISTVQVIIPSLAATDDSSEVDRYENLKEGLPLMNYSSVFAQS